MAEEEKKKKVVKKEDKKESIYVRFAQAIAGVKGANDFGLFVYGHPQKTIGPKTDR